MPARTSGRRNVLLGLGSAALLAVTLAGTAGASSATPAPAPAAPAAHAGRPSVPPAIQVPAGNRPVARMSARGVQVYQCTGGAWTFLEPVAQLRGGGATAIHFRGPSWESTQDGSLVEAAAVASSPVSGAIPQLLLAATRTRGSGLFGGVTYVQRLRTAGGLAPATACATGQTTAVPYTAEYRFFVTA